MLLGATVGELEERMSSRELAEWMAYHRIHPLPDPHWSAALICSTLANAWGASTSIEDFLPATKADEPTPEEDLAAFSAFASAHNALVLAHG